MRKTASLSIPFQSIAIIIFVLIVIAHGFIVYSVRKTALESNTQAQINNQRLVDIENLLNQILTAGQQQVQQQQAQAQPQVEREQVEEESQPTATPEEES